MATGLAAELRNTGGNLVITPAIALITLQFFRAIRRGRSSAIGICFSSASTYIRSCFLAE